MNSIEVWCLILSYFRYSRLAQSEFENLTECRVGLDLFSFASFESFIQDCPDGKLNRKKFTEVYQKFYPEGKADEFSKCVSINFCRKNNRSFISVQDTHSTHLIKIRTVRLISMNLLRRFPSVATAASIVDWGWHSICLSLDISSEKFKSVFSWFFCFRYDISNDGQIDEKELIKLITAIVNFPLEIIKPRKKNDHFYVFQYDLVNEEDRYGEQEPKFRAAQLMAKIDVSGDKKINKTEFIARWVFFLKNKWKTNEFFISISSCKNDASIRRLLAPNSWDIFKGRQTLFFNAGNK